MVGEDPWRCNDCRALESMSFAFDTPLVLRFRTSVPGLASLLLRLGDADPLPARFSPPVVESTALASVAVGASIAVELSSFPGDEPNILFSRPPELEKLRRLLPARLSDGVRGNAVTDLGRERARGDCCGF